MTRSTILSILFMAGLAFGGQAFGQVDQKKLPDDVRLLIGKHVVVGRLPLCIPNTYTANLSYAGKQATVISVKNSQFAVQPSQTVLNRIPPNIRAGMEDTAKGGTVLFQFEDGTKLDTCVARKASELFQEVELAAGETITVPVEAQVTPRLGGVDLPAQQCPVIVTGVSSGFSLLHSFLDGLTTSEFERRLDQAAHGGQGKHYLDIRTRNVSEKPVTGIEMVAAYANKMGDPTNSSTMISQNKDDIKPGEEYKASAMDRGALAESGIGQVTVYISRVRFSDNVFWQDNGSHSCSRTSPSE